MTVCGRLAGMAGMLIMGEMAGFACVRFSSSWLWAAGVAILLSLAAYGWRWPYALPFSVFAFGLVAALRTDALLVEALEGHWMFARGGATPAVALKVEGDVQIGQRKDGGRTAGFFSHLGPMPLKAVLPLAKDVPSPEKGEIWRCEGWISRRPPRGGRFGCRMFWGKAGTRIVRLSRVSVADRRRAAISEACAARAAIGLDWCPLLAAVNRAILLGRRGELPADRRAVFAQAGTVHVFAISGLHVMLLAVLLCRLLVWARVPVRVRGLVALPVLAAYVMVTGLRPSAVRAAMMAGLYMLAPTFGRKGDSLAAWSLTALAVFGYAPERLHDTGCVLSFAVMLGIVAWLRWVAPCLPSRCREGYGGECGVSVAAWISGTPIVAAVFGVFTPGGLVANLVVLRLVGCLVAFGMAGMAFGFVFRPAAALFNNLAATMSFLMMQISTAVAALPFASFAVEPWSWSVCLAWYGGFLALLALATGWWRRRSAMGWLGLHKGWRWRHVWRGSV